jgi:hypothetical protein
MPSVRVVPWIAKFDQRVAVIFEQQPHATEDVTGIREVFERIGREDHIDLFVGCGAKLAFRGHATTLRLGPSSKNARLLYLQANDAPNAAFGELDTILPIAATEIQHYLAG